MNDFDLLPNTPEEYISITSFLNKRKNRYSNVLTIDKTRVKLQNLINDYINANYIDDEHNKFIATQAPLPHTIRDFWKMVWDQNSLCILMLCELSEKNVNKYWSSTPLILGYNEDETLDNKKISIKVVIIKEEALENWVLRVFDLIYNGEVRKVHHLQYTKWEDGNEPVRPEHINLLIDKTAEYSQGGTCIVHCSAGIGRTGTFFACSILKSGINKNIFEIIIQLRKQRCNMVQTEKQYKFIFLFLKYLDEFRQTGSSNTI